MFTEPEYESFVELYSIGKTFTFARNNFREHIDSGAIGAWVVSMIGFCIYFVGVFTKGLISFAAIAYGTPLIIVWGIYMSQNPSKSGQRQHVKNKLNYFYENNKINSLMQYLSSHYLFESSLLSWRKGVGVFMATLWLGYILGSIGNRNKELDYFLTSLLTQWALALTCFTYLVSTILIYRIDRIAMGMMDIKKYDFINKKFQDDKE